MQDIIHEALTKQEVQTLGFVLRLLDKYPISMVVSELSKYKRELEDELDMGLEEYELKADDPAEYARQVDGQ